jgi:NADH-quinone oxidoreductase subunit J
MLTHHIDDRQITNRSVGRVPALVLVGILTFFLVRTITTTVWVQTKSVQYVPTTSGIGEALLSSYLLPFEVASVVLLAALVGSVVIARKELKEESPT